MPRTATRPALLREKRRLEDLRRSLRTSLQTAAHRTETTGEFADAALDTTLVEANALQVSIVAEQLADINDALACPTRQKKCVDCGTSIPAARRRAMPSAKRCISCQMIVETSGHELADRAPFDRAPDAG